MEAKRTVTLPGYGNVWVEFGRGDFCPYIRIWTMYDGKPDEVLAEVRKRYDRESTAFVWAESVIKFGGVELRLNQIETHIALLKLAKEQAEALDREFVPGTEVTR